MQRAPRRSRATKRGNWGLRGTALLGSLVALAGFWQLAAHNPHPNLDTEVLPTATPTDAFTIPSGGNQNNPLPLPTAPHSGTGVSH